MNTRAFGLLLAFLLIATGPVFGALTDGLVVYYSFDTNTGTTVVDQSGNGHNATVYGATYAAAGRVGGAFHYDGTNDYILAGNLGYQGQGTISFWMHADAVENWRNPFSTDYASWDDCLRFEESVTNIFVMGLGPILGGRYYTSNFVAHTWTHVVFAWTTNRYWGWLDGKPAFTGSHNNQLFLDFNNVAIGNGYSTDPNRFWKGMVDEVRIYNRVLSDAEVTQLANPSDGLILYYSFDTNTGSTVVDQSGNGHTGAVHGAAYTPAGRIGGAYHYDGTNDYILAGNLGYQGQGTIAFWMYADAIEDFRNVFSTDYASWDDCIRFECSARVGNFVVGALGLVPGDSAEYMSVFSPARWYHVVFAWTSTQAWGYLDGQYVFSRTHSGSYPPGMNLNFANVAIGNGYSTDANRYWKGLVDEVRIYNRVLSAAEVAELAGQGAVVSNSGTSLYYSFDKNDGATVTDDSGNGHTALVKGAQYTDAGVSGGAYEFNGTNWIEAGDIFDLTGATTQLTVCAWVKAKAAVSPNEPTIVSKCQEASPYRGWLLVHEFDNDGLSEIVATWPQLASADGTSTIGDEQWHFICTTYEAYPSLMRCRVYVDGVLENTGTRTGPYGSTEAATPLTIGARQPNGISHWGFKGLIDEVRIDTRILSDAEILALYDADKPGTSSNGLAKSLYYNFDTDEHGIVTDQSGDGNNGTVQGATWVPDGIHGGAYQFSGTNWIEAGDIFDLTGATTQLTVSAWIKAKAVVPWNEPTIVSKMQEAVPYSGWILIQSFYDKCLGEMISTWPQLASAPGTSIIGDKQWHFVCSTYEAYPSFMRCRVYVDGVLENTGTRTGPYDSTKAATPLTIGARQPNGIPHWGFNGVIDEVRIDTRILSDAEILALYDADKPNIPSNSPAKSLYYSFDTDEHSIVTDQSGDGNNGAVRGATWVPDGVRGGAYQFSGTNWIEAGDIFDLTGATTQLTVSAWIKAKAVVSPNEPTIVGKMQEALPYTGWILVHEFNNNCVSETIATWPQLASAPGTSIIGDEQWHFVCSTYETYPGLMRCRVYVDGVLENTGTRTGPYDSTKAATPLTIGARQPNGIPHWGFKGLIDEVRINNRILSDAEILALYDADKPVDPLKKGLELYYSFDTNTGATVYDQSGNGNNAQVKGALYTTSGVSGGAYEFNGTNWLEAGDIFDLAGATTQLTVSAWIKAKPVGPSPFGPATQPAIVSKQQEEIPYRGWILAEYFYNNCFSHLIATYPQEVITYGTSIIGDDQWHFVCSTYETYPGFMRTKVYVDGLLEDTATRTGPYDSTEASTPLTIGARQPNGMEHWGFHGLIDELRIYERILSDTDVLALYDANKPVDPMKKGLELYYSFDTNTGATVYDQSGNGHTGLIYGPAYTANGCIGGAYQYDGIDDHILAGNLGHFGQGTISFWMNADALENWRNPFSTDYASWDDCLRFEESSLGEFVVGLGPILGGAFYTSAMQPHTWYHVAFAWTGTGYWGWLNGQLAFSGSHNNQLYLDFNNVALGNGYSTSPGRYWKGMVDEVRIYSRVLSDGEIATLAGTGAVDTVGWLTVNIDPEGARAAEAQWKLSSDAGTNWYDSGFSRGLEAGDYTVIFKTLGGWVTPSSANVTIAAGSNSVIVGHYEADEAEGPDTVPPVIVSFYPPDGYACLGNDVPMIVVVTDNVAVASVRFNHSNAVDFEPPNTYLYTRNGVRGSFNPVTIVARDTYDNVTTQTLNYVQSSDLLLSALWDGYWRIRNPYTNTIECTWNVVVGGVESGAVTAVANRDNFFSTSLGPKTVQLYVDGVPVGRPVDSSKVHPDQGVVRALSEIDSDGDGMNNGEEELAGTNPNSEESFFSLGMDRQSDGGGMILRADTHVRSLENESSYMVFSWPSGVDSSYTLETSTNVWTWKPVTGLINTPGNGGIMSYTNRSDSPQFYLRIRAQKLE